MQEKNIRQVNKRKSLSKKVIGSFKVDLNEVRARVEKSSREENFPSNWFQKI